MAVAMELPPVFCLTCVVEGKTADPGCSAVEELLESSHSVLSLP